MGTTTLTLTTEVPAGEPPAEFRILSAGETATTKGSYIFDEVGAASVMQAYSDHGQELLPVDYDHGMLSFSPTPDGSSAAGWFVPALNDDGDLMATQVQWTPKGEQKLTDREYRYLSPAITIDEETGRVLRLLNVALTNLPATRDAQPLVAHQDAASEPQENVDMDELLKLLGAASEAEAIVIASEWTKVSKELLKLTATDSLDAAFGVIKANAELPAKVAELSTALDELRKADGEREKTALIATLSESGKLPPALGDWAKTQSLESLRAFGEAAPVLTGEDHDPPEGDTTAAVLTDEDRAVMAQTGISEEAFVAIRTAEGDDK